MESGFRNLLEKSEAYMVQTAGQRAPTKLAHPKLEPDAKVDQKALGKLRVKERCCEDMHPSLCKWYDEDLICVKSILTMLTYAWVSSSFIFMNHIHIR